METLVLRLGALVRRLIARYRREPAAVNALVAAVVGLASTLGLNLPQGAAAGLMAILAAVAGLVTRAQVTPVARASRKTVATRRNPKLLRPG